MRAALLQLLLACCVAGHAFAQAGMMNDAAPAAASAANPASAPAAAASTPVTRPPLPPRSCFVAECLEVIGGGNVTGSPVGDFPDITIPGCRSQLATYLKTGSYLRGVGMAARSAMAPAGQPTIRGAGGSKGAPEATDEERQAREKLLVVFDIDETLMSNVLANPDLFVGPEPAGRRRLLASMAVPNLPPLAPMKEVYQAVCAAGHPIALITGRKESNRAITVANLKQAGYGEACADDGATRADKGAPCCYSALVLRGPADTGLASVYKPSARGALVKKHGFTVYAAYGDQFSDMNGENAPQFAFKLPNPFYTIL